MAKEPAPQPEKTLDRIMQERREKGQALRAAGSDPYRNDIRPAISLAEVRSRYAATKPAPIEKPALGTPAAPREKKGIQPIDGADVRVGGRVLVLRDKGKVIFAPIRDTTGDLQLFLNIDHLAPDDWTNIVSKLDAGDQVVAEGPAFWTNTGELSILTKRLWIVTKSLRPLPDKWHGLSDVELRYRQRYVDLDRSNPDVPRGVPQALADRARHPRVPRRARLPRGRDADDASDHRRRRGAAVRHAPQRARHEAVHADRAGAVPQAPRRRRLRARLRDQPQLPQRGAVASAQPRVHDARVLSGVRDLLRT